MLARAFYARHRATLSLCALVLTALGAAGSVAAAAPVALARTGLASAVTAARGGIRLAAATVVPPTPLPPGRVTFATPSGAEVHAYPPRGAAPEAAPVVVMLHGMCMEPRSTCDYWSEAGREGRWLVCPAGNARCGSQYDWAGGPEQRGEHLEAVLDALQQRYPGRLDRSDVVLVGFSRGAFVARDAAYGRPGRYRALVLIGAAIDLDAGRLKQAGIAELVMAAGDHDGARPSMIRATARLRAAGLPTRFVGTGPIYHQLPANLGGILRGVLARLTVDAGDAI